MKKKLTYEEAKRKHKVALVWCIVPMIIALLMLPLLTEDKIELANIILILVTISMISAIPLLHYSGKKKELKFVDKE